MRSVSAEKRSVERSLGRKISDELFKLAKDSAVRKQRYIFSAEGKAEVLEPWYLDQLIKEQVMCYELMEFTAQRCRHEKKKGTA